MSGSEPGTNEAPHGTVTFLFTDIEGSTALVRRLKRDYGTILELHNRLLRRVFASHGGHEVDTQGDAFLVAFRRARDAVEAAVAGQRALAGADWPADAAVTVRMGIHTTEPGVRSDGYHGLGVVRGARICAAGHGGQVLLSAATRSLIADDEIDGIAVRDLGVHRLKGIERPERIYQLVLGTSASSFPPLRTEAEAYSLEGREGELAAAAEAAVTGSDRMFRILGPLEVIRNGAPVAIAGPKQRALLAALLVRVNEVVSTDRLIDDLWGEQPPRTAATSLQNFVAQLRKSLGADVLLTRAPGYVLEAPPEAVDASQFEQLLAAARASPLEERADRLNEALALWRGEPLAEFAYAPFAQAEIRRLEELRLLALEERLDTQIERGRHAEVIGEVEALVAQNPLRERLRGQLMLALYRAGRQAEALQAYQDARVALVQGLGIDPGPALQHLHASILRQDDALALASARGRDTDPDHFDEVARALLGGRAVVVLGRGVWDEPADEGVAAQLATRFGLELGGGLSRVAQLVALKQGVGPLYDELHDAFARTVAPSRVHEFAARLPALARAAGAPNPLLLTTHYDSTLERALTDAGELFDVVAYVASGRDRGKFVHVGPQGTATLVDVPNAYAALSLDERPIIVKLHGHADEEAARERESFVVSEDDYIGYLAQSEITNLVPVAVAAKLRRSHFLFLGYPLHEWHLRVFLHRVWGEEQVAWRSWAVERAPDALGRDFWRQRGVDIIEADLAEYVERLERRLRERSPVKA